MDKVANDSHRLIVDAGVFCPQHVYQGWEGIALDYLVLVVLVFERQCPQCSSCSPLDLFHHSHGLLMLHDK